VTIRSFLQLPKDVQFDSALYWVDGLEGVTPTLRPDNVTQYFRLDLRLAWRPIDSLELSVVGQNLLDGRHAEYFDIQGNQSSQIPRSGFLMVRFDL
jgi:iron complex outermembrane receptor protein